MWKRLSTNTFWLNCIFSSYNLGFYWALGLFRKVRQFVYWKPEPRRLLTEEEYQKQGEEETRHALEELRKYCNSPEFSPWKAVSRLQSPKRCGFLISTYFCQKSLMSDILLIHMYNKRSSSRMAINTFLTLIERKRWE